MATLRIAAVAAVVVALGALTAEAQQVSEKANRDRKLITADEIDAAHVNNAYEVVEKLRPELLSRLTRPQTVAGGAFSRGTPTSSRGGGAGTSTAPGMSQSGGRSGAPSTGNDRQQDPTESTLDTQQERTAAVFVDGTNMGGVEELKQIQSTLIEEIRYLSGSDAGFKYGPRFSAGVLEVKLKTQ
jgi:hypothetical protein